jgi:hypothetical protein
MPDNHIAEWILTLVTGRDRAACTVGDLTEQAAARGVVWFWSGVLRTAASFLWRGVAEKNARAARLALLGLAIYVGIEILHAGFTGGLLFRAAMSGGAALHLDSTGWKIWFAAPMPVSSLLIGWLLARWAPGRELAACVVFAVLVSIYDLLDNNGGFSALLSMLIVSAAAAWGRHRRQVAE